MQIDDSELRAFIKEELERQLRDLIEQFKATFPAPEKEEKYFSVQQIAKDYSVSVPTVYRHIYSGELAHIKVKNLVRVSESALTEFLKAKPKYQLKMRRKFRN